VTLNLDDICYDITTRKAQEVVQYLIDKYYLKDTKLITSKRSIIIRLSDEEHDKLLGIAESNNISINKLLKEGLKELSI
jgi:predicted HicB family RNase H-like nuclease